MSVPTTTAAESLLPRAERVEWSRLSTVQRGPMLWLVVFTLTGIGLALAWEQMVIHAGPASEETFFVCLIGYWAQTLVGGGWVLRARLVRPNPRRDPLLAAVEPATAPHRAGFGVWNRRAASVLVLSALFDGASQALNYVAMTEGGYVLYAIFHTSVTFFACVIAVIVLRARVSAVQWAGAALVVGGIFVTSFPQPVVAEGSFAIGLIAAAVAALFLAASYPTAELVFRLADRPPSEARGLRVLHVRASTSLSSSPPLPIPSQEVACFLGSLFNTGAFTLWTLAYTVPRWHAAVIDPIHHAKEGSVASATWSYLAYALLVGLHSLSFWKSVVQMGTVATAISKGAQQAGILLACHIVYCSSIPSECLTSNGNNDSAWNAWQKPVACICSVCGVVVYALGRRPRQPAAKVDDCVVVAPAEPPSPCVSSAPRDD